MLAFGKLFIRNVGSGLSTLEMAIHSLPMAGKGLNKAILPVTNGTLFHWPHADGKCLISLVAEHY